MAGVLALLLIGGAGYAATRTTDGGPPGPTLAEDLAGRNGGQQVLGGELRPGVPSVQRLRHDDVTFTVTVAPSRPGPNLVRLDVAGDHHTGGPDVKRFSVGTSDDDRAGRMIPVRPRPGVDGLWAVVDLPAGTGTVLVTHGPRHRVPFSVETGEETPDTSAWTGADGPECVAAASAAVLAGGAVPSSCPAERLDDSDRAALVSVVDALAGRGLRKLAIRADHSARGAAAYDVAAVAAKAAGLDVVDAEDPPGRRNALLVVSGWEEAATTLAAANSLPLRRQPIRSDGIWLAPWLLSPSVVDATSGAVLPLNFDIRDAAAREFSQTLATYLPGQAPTASGYAAWRAARGDSPDDVRLYAASRAAYLPAQPGHAGHETEVAWFPGGTVTPIGSFR